MVRLRELYESDAPRMLEWMHDVDVVDKMQKNFSDLTYEDCLSFIRNSKDDVDNCNLAVVDETNTYIGSVSLKGITDEDAEFAIVMRRDVFGTGASERAMALILDHGFRKLGLKRIYWYVRKDNLRAVRFYDKQCFRQTDEKEGMVWYEITEESFVKKRKYVLFGAGEYGRELLDVLGKECVEFFIDNDSAKIGTDLDGIPIYALEEKSEETKNYDVFISVGRQYANEIKKQLIAHGITRYTSLDEQIYYSLDEYHKGKKDYELLFPDDGQRFWGASSQFSTRDIFPEQYANERRLLFDSFIPLLPQDAVVADLGCASGEWTREVAPHVKHIDGFDYSEKMIKTAKERSKEMENIDFHCCDIRMQQLEKKYDGIMMFGVLMYVFEKEKVYDVLYGIRNVISDSGFLLTKDTLNISSEETIYTYNPLNGYSGCYYAQNQYYAQFIKAGFLLVKDMLLSVREPDSEGNCFISRGAIWKKM